jgi:hypothetical protein
METHGVLTSDGPVERSTFYFRMSFMTALHYWEAFNLSPLSNKQAIDAML